VRTLQAEGHHVTVLTRRDAAGHPLKQHMDLLRKDMQLLRASITARLGCIQVLAAGVLFAALKLT
jgi:hypothetical protein